MDYDPFLETMMVERSLDKLDQVEMDKEIARLREENSTLKKQLGYKRVSVKSYNYNELVEENIKLKQKLGIAEDEIIKSIKDNDPYKKSNHIGIAYIIFSAVLVISMIIFMIVLLVR